MQRQHSFSLPSPTDTPYRTPSSSLSHRSRDDDMSPSPTPPPLPTDMRIVKKRSSGSQKTADESLSPLDPRRFTPTLHASLVSEILSLRRDLESKIKSIDQLEQSLESAQTQNAGLSKNLLASNKEIRTVKRQMQLLEGGTLSALNELSKERDEVLNESSELRKRLEQSQRRAKSYEDSVDRTHALWEKDKDSWAAEKRTLETKTHVAESRLKRVLSELAQAQTQLQPQPQPEPMSQDREVLHSPPASPIAARPSEDRYRRGSAASTSSDYNEGRSSALSFREGLTTNLAHELALDDIDENEADEYFEGEGRISPDALPEENTRPSSRLSDKATKVLGLNFGFQNLSDNEKPVVSTEFLRQQKTMTSPTRGAYVDSAIQYSPPSSPDREQSYDTPSSFLRHDTPSKPDMVSSSSQTSENIFGLSPTPDQSDGLLTTIHESAFEKAVTRDMCTQTDIRPRPGSSRYMHSRTSTHDLGIPTIAIIPPSSRPATPVTHIMLPPQTKNASCQADSALLYNYTSSSMQTEEIRVDRRNMFASRGVTETSSTHRTDALSLNGRSASNRPWIDAQASRPASNSSSLERDVVQNLPAAPLNDDGPLSMESSLVSSRPIRSSSLFAGFDDYPEDLEEEIDDAIFYEDDYSTRPTAKFTLRSGKLVSQESTLKDIGELTAATAGEAVALDNLRRSETLLPRELRQFDLTEQFPSLKRQDTVRRAPLATKSANVRKAALISSGVAAHQSKLSQSTVESASVDGSRPPPIPIPLRYSSARAGKSHSESGRTSRGSSYNTSPTRQHRTKHKHVLRKARSGPAISPAAQSRRPISRSPTPNSRVSIVPEMPQFEMPGRRAYDQQFLLTNDFTHPAYEAQAPRPAVATTPGKLQSHVKQVSDPSLLQQTSVVDSIAQTMVGEWMYKYVRRRKSFGKPDKDWDPNRSVEELTSNPTSAGVRHKRWVWLAPYERAVMWSSKQPMTGLALLGKSGRKLTIKSVLDVKDENPMPKNSLTGPVFNRSILILTPQRALKFTATNQERHYVWLAALSFLSHSPLSIGDLAALPPPPDEYRNPSPSPLPVGGSFRRRTLRDSLRIAKGINRAENGQKSAPEGSAPIESHNSTRPPTQDHYNVENNVALPPTIRRFHTRLRSNTAPRPAAESFLPVTERDVPSSYQGALGSGTFERVQFPQSFGNSTVPNKRRGSEASAFGRPTLPNAYNNTFSDSSHNASMTMRMDAFIEHKQAGKGGFKNLRLGGPTRATNKDLSFWGIGETTSPISPVDSTTAANTSVRLSDSTGGTVERDFFRAF